VQLPMKNGSDGSLSTDIGLTVIPRDLASQPFCVFGLSDSPYANSSECFSWAEEFVCENGSLILLSEDELKPRANIRTIRLVTDATQRSAIIHMALVTASSNDVILLLGKTDDKSELIRAIKGLDLPASYLDFND
jgi:hypothetical protein